MSALEAAFEKLADGIITEDEFKKIESTIIEARKVALGDQFNDMIVPAHGANCEMFSSPG